MQHYKEQNNYPEDSTFQNNCYNLASTGKLAVFSVAVVSIKTHCREKQTVISFFLRDDFVDKCGLYKKEGFFCASITNILIFDSALIFKNKRGSRQTFFLIALPFTVASKDNCMFGYCSIIIFLLEHVVSLAFLSSWDLLPLKESIKSSSVLQNHN